jgi:hypothetical protein
VSKAELPETAATQKPPQPAPVLRTETVAIVVAAIVTDRKGRHVLGLSAHDFRLYEDNIQQTIVSFTPPRAAPGKRREAKAARSPGVVSTPASPATEQHNRTPQLITLLIDIGDIHSDSLKRACDAASQFADKTIARIKRVSVYR